MQGKIMFKNVKCMDKIKKLLLLMLLPIFAFASTPLTITFSEYNKAQDNGKIVVTLKNHSSNDIYVLKWNTVLEERLSADIFTVHTGKDIAKYIGRVVKRSKPKDSDYVFFRAGEKRKVVIELPKYYDMDTKGKYEVGFKGILRYKASSKNKINTVKMSKNILPTLNIFFIPTEKKTLEKVVKTTNFNACSQSKKNILDSAHNAAITMSKEASDVMNAAAENTSGERYTTWFGASNQNRQSRVTTQFSSIYTALDTQNIIFDCTCTEDFYAYVYPSQPFEIYICNIFWDAELTGTDSKAGTIIHEVSHFTVVASTDDHVYGQSGSQALAISNPENAVNNADSHEYFAENTPFLSMDNIFDTSVDIAHILADLPLDEVIGVVGEKDLYTFLASQTGTYTFYTTGSLDTVGILYDDTYTSLIENDDQTNENRNFNLKHALVQGRKYYLSVRAYGNNVGDYTLHSSIDLAIFDFVERFYVKILNRPSDHTGLHTWVNQLAEGTKAAQDIAKGFINSSEFAQRELSNAAYLEVLYQAFFNRSPDTSGYNGWLSQLSSGLSRDKVLDGFLGSLEFKNLAESYGIKVSLTDIENFVSRFYEQCLLRSPDVSGLRDWATQLSNGSKSGADIARGFIFSEEFTGRSLSNAEYLYVLYRAFFARDADMGGFNSWLEQLNGGVDRPSVLEGFLGAAEFSNLANAYGIRAR